MEETRHEDYVIYHIVIVKLSILAVLLQSTASLIVTFQCEMWQKLHEQQLLTKSDTYPPSLVPDIKRKKNFLWKINFSIMLFAFKGHAGE